MPVDRCIECKEEWIVDPRPADQPNKRGVCKSCGAATHPTRSDD